jgi:hypothetical protein
MIPLDPASEISHLHEVPDAMQKFARGSLGFVMRGSSGIVYDAVSDMTYEGRKELAQRFRGSIPFGFIGPSKTSVPDTDKDMGLHTDRTRRDIFNRVDVAVMHGGEVRWVGLPYRKQLKLYSGERSVRLQATDDAITGVTASSPKAWSTLQRWYEGERGVTAVLKPGDVLFQPTEGPYGNAHSFESLRTPRITRFWSAAITYTQ